MLRKYPSKGIAGCSVACIAVPYSWFEVAFTADTVSLRPLMEKDTIRHNQLPSFSSDSTPNVLVGMLSQK